MTQSPPPPVPYRYPRSLTPFPLVFGAADVVLGLRRIYIHAPGAGVTALMLVHGLAGLVAAGALITRAPGQRRPWVVVSIAVWLLLAAIRLMTPVTL